MKSLDIHTLISKKEEQFSDFQKYITEYQREISTGRETQIDHEALLKIQLRNFFPFLEEYITEKNFSALPFLEEILGFLNANSSLPVFLQDFREVLQNEYQTLKEKQLLNENIHFIQQNTGNRIRKTINT
jgi:hypothetical protein